MPSINDLPPPPAPSSGISDLPPPPSPGMFDGAAKSAIDSLPMIGGVAGGILGTPADAVMGPMGNVTGAAIGGYLGTAAKNLINRYYDPASAPQSMTDVMAQPVTGGVEQGLMQGTGEAAAPLISKGAQALGSAAKWTGSKVLSSLGGVSPDVIKEYAQYSDRINKAPSVDALKDISDDFVGKLASDVDAKKVTLDQAQDAFKGFQGDLKDAYKTAGYDARDAVTSAQQSLKDAHNARIQQLSGDIYDTVNKLKSDVRSGSSEAYKTLDKSNALVDLAPVYSKIDSSIDSLNKAGTKEALGVANSLQDYKSRLMENNWSKIAAPDAKELIQGLDKITDYNPNAGTFDNMKSGAFKDIRSSLDKSLKSTAPEYAAAMKPVAADSTLLGQVQPFGDKQTAAGLLQRINSPTQMETRSALDQLGKKYGTDFVSAAQPENLPEQQLLNRAQATQDALRPDRVADKIDQTLANSRQKSALDQAQQEYAAAQDKISPFRPLAPNSAGQTTAQQKLMQLGKGNNIELTDMFQKLGKMTDTDFVQAMKDNQIKAAFQKGATNGSRNTLMGSVVGWMFGGVPGMAGGAAAGRAVDQWGPAITKKVLDGAVRVANSPSAGTIAKLELPEPIKRNMIIGLENYLSQGGQAAEQSAARVADSGQDQNRAPAKGPDAWARQGIQKLGIQDQGLVSRIIGDPKGKQLLIQLSGLTPGSKAFKNIQAQIQKGWGQG